MIFGHARAWFWVAQFAALTTVASTHALTIVTSFVSPGQSIPGSGVAAEPATNVRGGGTLDAVFRAAADAWERTIADDFTVTVNYGWGATAGISATAFHQGISYGGTPSRESVGSIVFNADAARPFVLDPTPLDNEEFDGIKTNKSDFGGGSINIQREFAPITPEVVGAVDLLSTAVHELGHALGLAGWPFYTAETSDGDIDVMFASYLGSSIPTSGTHLSVGGPAMSSTGRPVGYRRAITDLDVIAVSQVSQFQRFVLPPEADFNGDWLVNQLDLTIWSEAYEASAIADANGNGVTDGTDFLVWQRQIASDAAPQFAVPEPAGAIGWLTFLLFASRRRRV